MDINNREPCAWWDRAVGGFYLSKESIPASILATPGRIVVLSPHHDEDFHICVNVRQHGTNVTVYDGVRTIHDEYYDNPESGE